MAATIPATMIAIEIPESGPPEVLEPVQRPVPEIGESGTHIGKIILRALSLT